MYEYRVAAHRDVYHDLMVVRVQRVDDRGFKEICRPMWCPAPLPGETIYDPRDVSMFSTYPNHNNIDLNVLQKLVDAAWDVGIRPSQAVNSGDALAVTNKWLEDMRTLVFKKVNSDG